MSVRRILVPVSALALVGGVTFGAGPAMAAGRSPAAAIAGCGVLAPGASAVAQQAVRAACGEIGVWYTWGGGHGGTPGPSYGHYDGSDPASLHDNQRLGFDCSGLTRFAYYKATGSDILDGPAVGQFHTSHATARFSAGQGTGPLVPGDLMFYGTGGRIHHVAMYLGAGMMVEAYESGTRIRATSARTGGDYAGAVRINGSGGGGVPPVGPPSAGKHWVQTYAAATGYAAANSANAQGVLNAGRNYVYCKVWGDRVGTAGQFNHWWMRTDLDRTFAGKNGRGAYVSAYYLSRWGNDQAKDVNGTDIPNC